MLLDLLREKKVFKLVCGAGNENPDEVEKLTALYSKAGCNFFDVSAAPEIVEAAKRGIEKSGTTKDRYLCVSVGIKGDPHFNKVKISSDLCIKCLKCISFCPQNAISNQESTCIVDVKRCIGCEKCRKVCPVNGIDREENDFNLEEILPPVIERGIDCIEYHAIGGDEEVIYEKWVQINRLYKGILSICADRSKLGNEALLRVVNKMLRIREPYTTIIQADGTPMSGGNDDYKTTLQTVAAAEIFQNAELPAFLLLSGGTNSKTAKLASLCGINANGAAIGSFARQIVREYITRKDFWTNEKVFSEALGAAKRLVESSKFSS